MTITLTVKVIRDMKKIIIALFCCVSLVGCDDGKVAVPDNNFERALIELDYDDLIDIMFLKVIKNFLFQI